MASGRPCRASSIAAATPAGTGPGTSAPRRSRKWPSVSGFSSSARSKGRVSTSRPASGARGVGGPGPRRGDPERPRRRPPRASPRATPPPGRRSRPAAGARRRSRCGPPASRPCPPARPPPEPAGGRARPPTPRARSRPSLARAGRIAAGQLQERGEAAALQLEIHGRADGAPGRRRRQDEVRDLEPARRDERGLHRVLDAAAPAPRVHHGEAQVVGGRVHDRLAGELRPTRRRPPAMPW